MKRIVILGAGISGLSLAWYLKRRFGANISLTLLEKEELPGGWVETDIKDGFIFEQGPRSCRPKGSGVETLKLVEQLGLQDQVITGNPAAKTRYLYTGKKLRPLPAGPFSFLFSPLMRGVIPALVRDFFKTSRMNEDESVYAFIARRFSPALAERLADPLVSGIYAGDIRKLSLKSCFPKLAEWERESGSILRGAVGSKKGGAPCSSPFLQKVQKASLFSFKGGMQTLVDELALRLQDNLWLDAAVERLHFEKDCIGVELANGQIFHADYLFSSIPSKALSLLFASVHQELSRLLGEIEAVSVACINLGYHRALLKKKGFGYLIPSKEKEKTLGTVFDSCVFPEQNQIREETRLTVMAGGALMPGFDALTEKDFIRIAVESAAKHLGIEAVADAVSVKIAHQAIPQYTLGHQARVDRIREILGRFFPRLAVLGNSFDGVSLNDCIANSKRIEENISATLFAKKG